MATKTNHYLVSDDENITGRSPEHINAPDRKTAAREYVDDSDSGYTAKDFEFVRIGVVLISDVEFFEVEIPSGAFTIVSAGK